MAMDRLTEAESKLADFLWHSAPLSSADLVKHCEHAFSWKKSTTYTMLKKLILKGLFSNQDGSIVPLLTRDTFYTAQSETLLEEGFEGSLPRFLAAFSQRKHLSKREIQALQEMIDQYQED